MLLDFINLDLKIVSTKANYINKKAYAVASRKPSGEKQQDTTGPL